MFIHLFSCDSLISIQNYDQNSLNIKLHVIFICKNEWLCMMEFSFMHSNNNIQFWSKIKQKLEIS
jgi:hypothetical protein